MPANHNDLLGMFRARDIADHVGGIDWTAGEDVLDIHFQTYGLALIDESPQLLGIFDHHADYRNVIHGVEAKCAGVRQIHAARFRTALSANHGSGMSSVRCLKKRPKLQEHLRALFARHVCLRAHQQDLAGPFAGVLLHLAIELAVIHDNDLALDAALGSRPDPTEGRDGQRPLNRREQVGAGGDARPAAEDLPIFCTDIAEPDRLHLRHAPLDRLVRLRRSGYATANRVAEFFQVNERVIVQRGLTGNRSQRRQCAVLRRRRRSGWCGVRGKGHG